MDEGDDRCVRAKNVVVELFELARTHRKSRREAAKLRFALDERDATASLCHTQRCAQSQGAAAQHANRFRVGIRAGGRHRRRPQPPVRAEADRRRPRHTT